MTSDDRLLVKEVFEAALDRDGAGRAALICEACAGRPEVRDEVESLLASHDAAGTFLDEPAFAAVAESRVGRTIGRYKLTGLIGEGGMGAVYRAARHDDFEQEVAIKLSKRGMDSGLFASQFQKERQILARLDHPNIARLFDGGSTEDGLSYFIMELVEGKPLDEYCQDNALPMPERLKLFLEICSAVAYAHQHLIIHRDIKPENILVTPRGVPKLLDFGIARVFTPDQTSAGFKTISMASLMTPEYASPEQVQGRPVTTTTDVYSLGVVLYELVTGHSPYSFETREPYEIQRVVCDADAPRPSASLPSSANSKDRRAVRGDLDNIILKALQKDPQRRYGSVSQLAEDIRRYQQNLPVTARAPTFTYRLTKLVTRYKAGVAAGVIALLALVGGLAGTTWQAHVANVQRQKAERRFQDVRQLSESLLFEIHDSIEDLPGATAARKLIVTKATRYLDSLSLDDQGDVALQRELAAGYGKVGEIQGMPGGSNLGDSPGALASFRKSVALLDQLVNTRSADTDLRRELAEVYGKTARVLLAMRKSPEALELFRKSFALRQELYAVDPRDWRNQAALAKGHYELGIAASVAGDVKSSMDHQLEAVRLFEKVSFAHPEPSNRRSLALVYKSLAANQSHAKEPQAALENVLKAIAIEESLGGLQRGNALARMTLSYSYTTAADALYALHDPRQALDYYRKALAIRTELFAADPKDKRTRGALGYPHRLIAYVLLDLHRESEALGHAQEALAIQEQQTRDDPKNAHQQADIADSAEILGDVYNRIASRSKVYQDRVSNWQHAKTYYQRAEQLYKELDAANKLQADRRKEIGATKAKIAACSAQLAALSSR